MRHAVVMLYKQVRLVHQIKVKKKNDALIKPLLHDTEGYFLTFYISFKNETTRKSLAEILKPHTNEQTH